MGYRRSAQRDSLQQQGAIIRRQSYNARPASAVVLVRLRYAIALLALCSFPWGGSLLRASYPKAERRNQISKNATTAGPFGEIVRGPRGKSEIALTFDAGAEAECFEDLIVALESAKVHSTFFVTGNWAQKNRDCAAAITKHGHEVGNHTWNHPNLTQQTDNIVREEISRAEVILNELTGQSPRPLWRAPYGERDARVLRIASNLGYRSIYWTFDSLDGVEPIKTTAVSDRTNYDQTDPTRRRDHPDACRRKKHGRALPGLSEIYRAAAFAW